MGINHTAARRAGSIDSMASNSRRPLPTTSWWDQRDTSVMDYRGWTHQAKLEVQKIPLERARTTEEKHPVPETRSGLFPSFCPSVSCQWLQVAKCYLNNIASRSELFCEQCPTECSSDLLL